jgi:hypothetical protein
MGDWTICLSGIGFQKKKINRVLITLQIFNYMTYKFIRHLYGALDWMKILRNKHNLRDNCKE